MIAPLLLGLTLATNAPAPQPVAMGAADVAAGKGDGWFVEVETRPVERLEVKEGTFFADETKRVLFFCPSESRCVGDINATERDKARGRFEGRVYVAGEDGFVTAGVPMDAVVGFSKAFQGTTQGVRVVVLAWVSPEQHGPELLYITGIICAVVALGLIAVAVYADRRGKRLRAARKAQ